VTVGDGANPLLSIDPTPATGRAPLSVSFRIEVAIPRTVTSWQLVLGDGIVRQGTGRPPRFAGHTYSQPGSYRVTLIVSEASTGAPARFIALAAVTVVGGAAAPPPPTGTPSGRVLVSGRPYTGGPIRYGSRVDVTNGALVIRADVGTLRVSGNGVSAVFVLVRTSENRRPFIELRLVGGDFSVCRTRKRSASHGARATPPPRTVRRLFSKGKGRFRTRGRYSSSSVRGTAWLTADRCDGTFTSVSQGRVLVVDLVRRRRVLVTAGRSYLTRRP
jgi:hypothetical protein